MRVIVAIALASVTSWNTTQAQEQRDRWELGTAVAGFGVIDGTFTFRIPGPVIQGLPAIHARFFTSDHLFVEPELGLLFVEEDYSLELGFGVGYRFTPEKDGTFYAAGNFAVARSDAGGFDANNLAPGAAAGYWVRVLAGAASASIEARLRYWTDPDFTDFGLVLKMAVLR